MLTCTHLIMDPQHGEWAVGYARPNPPGQFVVLVRGIYSENTAKKEVERLNDEAKARHIDAFVEHNARGTARGWYSDDNP